MPLFIHAPRVKVDYATAKDFIQAWSDKCQKIIVYEHPADESVSETHIHVLIMGCEVKQEQLSRIYYKFLSSDERKGNQLWAWEHKKWKANHPGQDYNDEMITYMSKGKFDPMYVKGFDNELIALRKSQWVEPVKQADNVLKSRDKKVDEWDEIQTDFLEKWLSIDDCNFERVRTWTMSWYWKKYGRLPVTSVYKRNAGSLWCLWNQKHVRGSLHGAFHEIMEKWY